MTDSRPFSSITLEEIASQPECWERAIELSRHGGIGLPPAGERVLVLGCGTSYFAAQAYASLREAAGHGETDALVASELPTRLRTYDRVVAISRSGTSTDVLDAVHRTRDVPVVAVLGEQGTPLAGLAHDVVDLSYADERSVVQTRFPTTFLTLVRSLLSGPEDPAVAALPGAGRAALTAPLPSTKVRQLVVLGHHWSVPVGHEAALKVRESAGAWAECYPVGEYRHGPISVAGTGTLVWGLTPLPEDLVEAVLATGAAVEQGGAEPLAELLRLQRFAVALAREAGRDADRPAHLSRSVVLERVAGPA